MNASGGGTDHDVEGGDRTLNTRVEKWFVCGLAKKGMGFGRRPLSSAHLRRNSKKKEVTKREIRRPLAVKWAGAPVLGQEEGLKRDISKRGVTGSLKIKGLKEMRDST